MRKYIKLEDAIGIIQNEIDKVRIKNDYDNTFRVGLRLAKNMLLDLPTIDIVRCKDCKYSMVNALDSNEEPQRWCKIGLAKAVDDDDYCSWGERYRMTKAKAEKIRKGIDDKIRKTTVDMEWWAYFRGFTVDDYEEFLDIAIKALEQKSSKDLINDLINRQEAIDGLEYEKEMLNRALDNMDIVGQEREKFAWGLGLVECFIEDIKELPSKEIVNGEQIESEE